MKQVTVVLVALFLTATAPPAFSEALKMTVGKADVAGTVSFTLGAGEETLQVAVVIEPMTAAEKAAALSAAVTAQDPSGTWRALATGAALSFEHMVDGVFQDADLIGNISDTTGAGTGLAKSDAVVMFKLQIDEAAVATGLDAAGGPSFITVSMTGTLAWTHPIPAGETAVQLVDFFYAFLLDQAGAGVLVTRTAPTTLEIELSSQAASLNWQITDTGLMPYAKGGGRDAGVIDR